MATWAQFGLQDASSPLMEELTYFHDYALIVLTLITILVSYGLASLMISSKTNRFFLEGQELETIWTIVPAIILIFIALPSLQLLYLMDEIKDPFLTIKAIGHQWYWRYEYTDYKDLEFDSYMIPTNDVTLGNPRLLEVDNRLIVPMQNPIRVLISSADVLHSWAVPSLGIKMDAVPGRLNQTTFFASRAGLFYGQCSEICGANHRFMPIVVEAVPFTTFEGWVAQYLEASPAPSPRMAEKTALEKEMEALMSGAGALSVDTKATQKNITKARRKSKDLEASLGDMAAVLNASNATQSFQTVMGARVRRKSADYSTDELKVAFDSVDLDKSGSIDKSELKKAIMAADKTMTEEKLDELIGGIIANADKDGDGQIDYQEFVSIMTTKPADAKPADAKPAK